MVSEKKRPRTYRRFWVWVVLILFVLLCGSAIFTARMQGNRDPGTLLPTAKPTHTKKATQPSITPSASFIATLTSTPVPLFTEDFNDNHNGWAVNTAEYLRTLSNQKLTLSVTNHTILLENVPGSIGLSDFTLSTTFTLEQADKNDKMGLYLRGDSNLDHDYRIDIFGNRIITMNKEYLDSTGISQSTQLAFIASKDSVLNPVGQENALQVMMNGPDITLWINGVKVKTLQDYDYTHGQAALFVQNDCASSAATVAFSSLDITSIPNTDAEVTPSATVTPSVTPTTPATAPIITPAATVTPCA